MRSSSSAVQSDRGGTVDKPFGNGDATSSKERSVVWHPDKGPMLERSGFEAQQISCNGPRRKERLRKPVYFAVKARSPSPPDSAGRS